MGLADVTVRSLLDANGHLLIRWAYVLGRASCEANNGVHMFKYFVCVLPMGNKYHLQRMGGVVGWTGRTFSTDWAGVTKTELMV